MDIPVPPPPPPPPPSPPSPTSPPVKIKRTIPKKKLLSITAAVVALLSIGSALVLATKKPEPANPGATPTPFAAKPTSRFWTGPSPTPTPFPLPTPDPAKFEFPNIEKGLFLREPDFPVTAEEGKMILSSVLSHRRDKLFYTQISQCVMYWNLPAEYNDMRNLCRVEFDMMLKNTVSGRIEKLKTTRFATSAGSPIIYMPTGWSEKDGQVLLKTANPTDVAVAAPEFPFATMNMQTLKITDLSTENPLLIRTNRYAIYTAPSGGSPICGWTSKNNHTGIAIKNLESGNVQFLKRDAISFFELKSVDGEEKALTYTTQPTVKTPEKCQAVDPKKPPVEQTMDLVFPK